MPPLGVDVQTAVLNSILPFLSEIVSHPEGRSVPSPSSTFTVVLIKQIPIRRGAKPVSLRLSNGFATGKYMLGASKNGTTSSTLSLDTLHSRVGALLQTLPQRASVIEAHVSLPPDLDVTSWSGLRSEVNIPDTTSIDHVTACFIDNTAAPETHVKSHPRSTSTYYIPTATAFLSDVLKVWNTPELRNHFLPKVTIVQLVSARLKGVKEGSSANGKCCLAIVHRMSVAEPRMPATVQLKGVKLLKTSRVSIAPAPAPTSPSATVGSSSMSNFTSPTSTIASFVPSSLSATANCSLPVHAEALRSPYDLNASLPQDPYVLPPPVLSMPKPRSSSESHPPSWLASHRTILRNSKSFPTYIPQVPIEVAMTNPFPASLLVPELFESIPQLEAAPPDALTLPFPPPPSFPTPTTPFLGHLTAVDLSTVAQYTIQYPTSTSSFCDGLSVAETSLACSPVAFVPVDGQIPALNSTVVESIDFALNPSSQAADRYSPSALSS